MDQYTFVVNHNPLFLNFQYMILDHSMFGNNNE